MHTQPDESVRHSGIAVGDLAEVVRPAYCRTADAAHGLGHIFRVGAFDIARRHYCGYCGGRHDGSRPVAKDSTGTFVREAWWDLRRLRRIPPLDELEQAEEKPGADAEFIAFLERT